MIEAAGVMLGLRPADQHDPHHGKYSAGAGLLLELACVPEDDPAIQEWIPVGAERRARWRCPANRGGIA